MMPTPIETNTTSLEELLDIAEQLPPVVTYEDAEDDTF